MWDAVRTRLAMLGHEMPIAANPLGRYDSVAMHGGVGCVSGQFPLRDGVPVFVGALGSGLSVEEGTAAAEVAALNALAQIERALGDFEGLIGLLRLDGIIASDFDFDEYPEILDGASKLFVDALEEKGRHARSLTVVPRLPKNLPVEVVVTFAYVP